MAAGPKRKALSQVGRFGSRGRARREVGLARPARPGPTCRLAAGPSSVNYTRRGESGSSGLRLQRRSSLESGTSEKSVCAPRNNQTCPSWQVWQHEAMVRWRRRDSNLRPRAYESPALPLSYVASAPAIVIQPHGRNQRRPPMPARPGRYGTIERGEGLREVGRWPNMST